MSERTLVTAVSDLIKTGLTVEQQVLVSEISILAGTANRTYERERKRQLRLSQLSGTSGTVGTSGTKEKVPRPLKENTTPLENSSSSPSPNDFADFWSFYPRKIGKGAALKAFRHALNRATAEAILAGTKRFAASVVGKDQEFIPHAATWLNADRWADELPAAGSNGVGLGPKRTYREIVAEREKANSTEAK